MSENDLLRLPVAIGNLIKLVELNLSKNCTFPCVYRFV